MLAARIQKQKSKGKGKPSVERKNKKEKKGNYNTYHEPLSEEWIERRS